MKTNMPSPTKRKTGMVWAKTPYPNLIRYKPSGTYFGRVRVNGKLIRRSLETHVLTVAKLKLSDFLQDHRRLAVNKGQSVNGEVIIEMFRREIEDGHNNKPRTKTYKREVLTALKKSWPELYSTDIAKSSRTDCNEWAARHGRNYSATRFNGALNALQILKPDEEVFRIFYYDCEPYEREVTNPVDGSVIDYKLMPAYAVRKKFIFELGQMDFVALRRGELTASSPSRKTE